MVDGQPPAWRDLLTRWKEGDVQAGNELYDRLSNALDGMIHKRAGGHLDVNTRHDIKQSVYGSFLRLVRKGQFEYRNTSGFFGYLKFIVRKKIARQRSWETPTENGKLEDSTPGSDTRIEQEDELAALLGRLKPRTRRIAELIVEGCTMGEVCEKEGCGRHTVRHHLNRIGEVMTQDSRHRSK